MSCAIAAANRSPPATLSLSPDFSPDFSPDLSDDFAAWIRRSIASSRCRRFRSRMAWISASLNRGRCASGSGAPIGTTIVAPAWLHTMPAPEDGTDVVTVSGACALDEHGAAGSRCPVSEHLALSVAPSNSRGDASDVARIGDPPLVDLFLDWPSSDASACDVPLMELRHAITIHPPSALPRASFS